MRFLHFVSWSVSLSSEWRIMLTRRMNEKKKDLFWVPRERERDQVLGKGEKRRVALWLGCPVSVEVFNEKMLCGFWLICCWWNFMEVWCVCCWFLFCQNWVLAQIDKGKKTKSDKHDLFGRSGLITWKYQFSYNHWIKQCCGLVSTWMGNCSSVAWVLLLTLKVG